MQDIKINLCRFNEYIWDTIYLNGFRVFLKAIKNEEYEPPSKHSYVMFVDNEENKVVKEEKVEKPGDDYKAHACQHDPRILVLWHRYCKEEFIIYIKTTQVCWFK